MADWRDSWDLVTVEGDPFAPMSPQEEKERRELLYSPEEIKRVSDRDLASWVENQKGKLLAIGKALAAPGNALGGKYGLAQYGDGVVRNEPAFYEDASTLAGLLPVGGMVMPRPQGSLGVFGGIRAATADFDKLNAAKQLAQSGARRSEIWEQTGWFQGGDGEWRFEIPDRQSEFDFGYFRRKTEPGETGLLLNQALYHPELFKAYPDLKWIELQRESNPRNYGSILVGEHRIGLQTGMTPELLAMDTPLYDPHSTLLHEIQHGIQNVEGWAGRGTNPTSAGMKEAGLQIIEKLKKEYDLLDEEYGNFIWELPLETRKSLLGQGSGTERVFLREWAKKEPRKAQRLANLSEQILEASFDPAYAAYTREAGEVEARNVQKRFRDPLADLLRAPLTPWETQDFAYRDQRIYTNALMAK